jgi:quercetin dioxygenase-like cupin family protein
MRRSRDDIYLDVKALKLGSKIRELRLKKNYTLQDVAAKTGLGSDKIAITRHNERIRVEKRPHHRKGEVNYVYETLETKKTNKQMEPFLVEFPVQDSSEMVFMNHDGEEFLHVLEGTLEFRSVSRVEVLESGDSIYFESDLSHSFRCLGEKAARAIVVVWNG